MNYDLPRETDVLDIYQDHANEWRWRLKAGNHEVIADSGEGYVTKAGAEMGASRVFPVRLTTPRVLPPPAPIGWSKVIIVATLLGVATGLFLRWLQVCS